MTYDLPCIYDSRKSFYGKAYVTELPNGDANLYSYHTLVSICRDGKITHLGKWSVTTSRHQREFEKQYGRNWN